MTSVAESPTPKSLDAPAVTPAAQMNEYVLSLAEQDLFASRKRWTRKECASMEEAGLLMPGDYELLDGQIIPKVGQFRPHMTGCKRSFLALSLIFGTDYVLLPMIVSVDEENGPEPDVAVTRFPDSHYAGRNDQPTEDLRLVMEISVSTLWRDRNTKPEHQNGFVRAGGRAGILGA